MKKNYFILGIGLFLFSCGGNEEATEETTNDDNTTEETTEEVVESGAIDPFPDFPKDKLNAAAGDIVLSPSKNWQEDATKDGAENTTFIFYKQTLAEPGDQYSKVDFMGDKGVEIPNYMIVPIKPNQTAKKGDILLTWWQSGSGMKRAIVTDDSDPAAPVVNYIDIDWDNPAQNSEGVGFGQMTEQIEAGTFHVLTSTWAPGTTVAAKADGKVKAATVIAVSGDKVLTIGFAGKMAVYPKADCTPVPVKPNVKAGDAVQAPWVGSFVNTKVVKVDAAMGRVWCEDPYSDDPMVIPFGDVATGLSVE
ncbi:hypothetical protein K6119_06795 [Paracrocinitomix mangrovi]|uniref:hypothetical protein n=1 Tax=Paracrocinitomix mangrovi TaxID=2862509 RepID=UPI001C8EA270|nr:hypothetical protein [Paracrocinitomix mangrovi]UKN03221.1 hypothetical protein K6119_06795 [Paracrocinitomix mangrovi]